MVSVSHERAVESERRLLAVLRAAEVVHLEGSWGFQRDIDRAPPEAVAVVRHDEGWCALVPAGSGPGERFGLTRTTFPAGIDNSGFVGWLATTIKRRLGSGVFVVCGDNPGRGGIFDYLGYPIRIADEVRGLIDELRGSGTNEMRLQRTVTGRLRLLERFTWSDGASGRNVLQSLEQADAG